MTARTKGAKNKRKEDPIARWRRTLFLRRNGTASDYQVRRGLMQMRKVYERPDGRTLLLSKEEFYNPERSFLPERLGRKVRIARKGSPPSPGLGVVARFRAIRLVCGAMHAEQLERLRPRWAHRADEVKRLRKAMRPT